jgi:hypothetical protein
MMIQRTIATLLGLSILLGVTAPAQAYKWPGRAPAPGGAISAKVIGQNCAGVLSGHEIGEIDAYLGKAGRELDARAEPGAPNFETFASGLTATYQAKFGDPAACDADAVEEARDMLQRIRLAMVSGAPLYPAADDPARKPDIAEAMQARLTGEKCAGSLAALDLAELDLYIARAWVWWAKHASDADARLTMDLYKASAVRQERDWRAQDCTAAAISAARDVLSLVRRAASAQDSR